MTRVLVVGAGAGEEQDLLARLQEMAGLPQGSLVACRDPGSCEVLIVRDRPGLRSAALLLHKDRPQMQLWVEDAQGMLRDGGDLQLPLLRRDDIVAVLAGGHRGQGTGAQVIRLPLSASSRPDPAGHRGPVSDSREITRHLRRGIQRRSGWCLLQSAGQWRAAVDFASGQAVVAAAAAEAGCSGLAGAARWLGSHLEGMSLEQIGAGQFQSLETQGHRMPLRALLWQSAPLLDCWQRLDARLAAGARVHLEVWPDFRVLARQQDVFRLCSLLVRRPCSVAECAQILELPTVLVEDFVHSAYLSGYARIEAAAPSQGAGPQALEPLVPAAGSGLAPARGRTGLLARMWQGVRAVAQG